MKKEFKTRKDLMMKGKNRIMKKNQRSKTFISKGFHFWFKFWQWKTSF